MTSKNIKKIVVGSASAVVLVSLAACGGGGSSKPVFGSVTQVGQGARLYGAYSATELGAWVPDGIYPSSITESPDGLYSTGATLAVDANYSWSSMSCPSVTQESGGPGFGEEAYLIYQGQSGSGSSTEDFTYGAYEFPTAADAVAFVQGAGARYAACGSFSVTSNSNTLPVTLSLGATPDVPAANAVVDLEQSATVNGYHLVAQFVVAADGNMVVYAESDSANGSIPTQVSNAQVVQEILTAFASGEASGGSAADRVARIADVDGDRVARIAGSVAWAGESS